MPQQGDERLIGPAGKSCCCCCQQAVSRKATILTPDNQLPPASPEGGDRWGWEGSPLLWGQGKIKMKCTPSRCNLLRRLGTDRDVCPCAVEGGATEWHRWGRDDFWPGRSTLATGQLRSHLLVLGQDPTTQGPVVLHFSIFRPPELLMS